MRILIRILVASLLYTFSLVVIANEVETFHFKIHSQAKILYQEDIPQSDQTYILALGKYKKSNNRWLPSDELRLQGELKRYTLELPRSYGDEEVFQFYRQQLPATTELLFSCKKRQCGESNNWANDHFRVKQLYGSNASQYYAAVKLSANEVSRYITIYTVRRGNRRLYAQLELLTVSHE